MEQHVLDGRVAATNWHDTVWLVREKWAEVPSGDQRRIFSEDLLGMTDRDLEAFWSDAVRQDTEGEGFGRRGWYHALYSPQLAGKKCLDVGCGLGISSLMFARAGARVTFVDIVEDNVRVVERLCRIFGLEASFLHIASLDDLGALPDDFDAILALGSLHHAPLSVVKQEVDVLLPHLRDGGRWLHLTYPRARWFREGSLPFSQWGKKTDGERTPWAEYHDLDKMHFLFSDVDARLRFGCEWHNQDFNWFDFEIHRSPGFAREDISPKAKGRIAELEAELCAIRASRSWRMTAPLRWLNRRPPRFE